MFRKHPSFPRLEKRDVFVLTLYFSIFKTNRFALFSITL